MPLHAVMQLKVVLVEQTLDNLFNNTCDLDNRKYYKTNLATLHSSLAEYKGLVTIAQESFDKNGETEFLISIADKDIDYKNFDDLFEKVYREKLEAQEYNVFISGGLDSTTLYELLKSKDIAFKPHCIRYISQGIVFNNYEIKNISDDVNIIDFDILDFFDSGKFLETAQKYSCTTPQFLPLLKVFEDIKGPIIENSWPLDENRKLDDVSMDYMPSKYLTYRYALDMRNDESIFNFFRSHHFINKLISTCDGRNSYHSYGEDDALISENEAYTIKANLYKSVFNAVGTMTNKFTGFEALKVWYADKYIGNDPYLQVFDQQFREILQKRNIDKFQDLKIICILKEK